MQPSIPNACSSNPYLGPATTAEEYWDGLARLEELLRPLNMRAEYRMVPAFLAEACGPGHIAPGQRSEDLPAVLIDPFLHRVLGYDPAGT